MDFSSCFQDKKSPSKPITLPRYQKFLEAISEGKKWASLLEVRTVGELNRSIINGKISNIIKIQEALHERKSPKSLKQ